jgi:hypothetical protein
MASYLTMASKKIVFIWLSAMGTILTLLEIFSYIIFFHHVTQHNNNIAANILKPSIIKQRNKANAVRCRF